MPQNFKWNDDPSTVHQEIIEKINPWTLLNPVTLQFQQQLVIVETYTNGFSKDWKN